LAKKEGGLGVKNLEVWNRAAMVKHLWFICNPTKSIIFVVWYEYLGDSLPQNYSWSWVKILGLRGDVQKFIYFHVIDGDANLVITWSRNHTQRHQFLESQINQV
jgi:hypothetical protein